jgi:hypothetical protein
MAELKELIKAKNKGSSAFDTIPAKDLVLWKVSIAWELPEMDVHLWLCGSRKCMALPRTRVRENTPLHCRCANGHSFLRHSFQS